MQHSGLSDSFWAEALLTAIDIINMSLSRPLGFKIPQELWTWKKLDYEKPWIFICEVYELVPKDERRKLESQSRKCVLLNYELDGSFGYQLWDSNNRQSRSHCGSFLQRVHHAQSCRTPHRIMESCVYGCDSSYGWQDHAHTSNFVLSWLYGT